MLEFTSNKLESSGTAVHFRTVAGHLKYGACLGVLILLLLLNGSEMAHRGLDDLHGDFLPFLTHRRLTAMVQWQAGWNAGAALCLVKPHRFVQCL